MRERVVRSKKPQWHLNESWGLWRVGGGRGGALEYALYSLDVDELESERTLTRRFYTRMSKLVDETHELLRLAEFRPWEGAAE